MNNITISLLAIGFVFFIIISFLYIESNKNSREKSLVLTIDEKEWIEEEMPVKIERVWACDKIYATIKEALNQTVDYKNDSNCKLIWVHKTEFGAYTVPLEMVDKNLKRYHEWEDTNETIKIRIIKTPSMNIDNTAPKHMLNLETGEVGK